MRWLAVSALCSSTAVALELAERAVAGTLQFVNMPLIFSILAGMLAGARADLFRGVLSVSLSDVLLGPGPVDPRGLGGGLFAGARPLLRRERGCRLVAWAYLLCLAYDLATSAAFFTIPGPPPLEALRVSVGAPPASHGGSMVAVGPVTEAVTATCLAAVWEGPGRGDLTFSSGPHGRRQPGGRRRRP